MLIWATDANGERSTFQVGPDGRVYDRSPGVRIATKRGAWTWIETPVDVATAPCSTGGYEKPPGIGVATRASLVRNAEEQIVVQPKETPCCPNEARHTVALRASLGPLLFVEETDFSFECGAHGHTEKSFLVWDADRAERVDLLGALPDAERLEAAASRMTGELAPGDKGEITALFPVLRDGRVVVEAQVSAPACYACGDGVWSSYTRSVRLPTRPPAPLEPYLSVPPQVVGFVRTHPDLEVGGWSR